MNIDITQNKDIVKIKKTIEKFRLPTWDELPSIYLYMDQVIELTAEYFEDISALGGGEKILTAPMINNYIKLKVMPAPVKKRYGKAHLAYIFMISSLKQCMNISAMESVIPLTDDEEEIRKMYSDFTDNLKFVLEFLNTVIDNVQKGCVSGETDDRAMMLRVVLASSFMKVFASGMTSSFYQKNNPCDTENDDAKKNTKKEGKKESENISENISDDAKSDENEN